VSASTNTTNTVGRYTHIRIPALHFYIALFYIFVTMSLSLNNDMEKDK